MLLLAGMLAAAVAHADSNANTVANVLRIQLEYADATLSRQPLDWPRLREFYRSRDYRPVWVDGKKPLQRAELWRDTLKQASLEGLDPEAYHLSAIAGRWVTDTAATQAALDLLLVDAFIRYSVHARAGRLDPAEVDPDWHITPPPVHGVPFHWLTLDDDAFAAAVDSLPPPHLGYRRLRAALARYRKLQRDGGWPMLPPGPALAYGDSHQQLGLLRIRLMAEGDLVASSHYDIYRFDVEVREAVKRFQTRHGLAADGVVGPATRNAMNVPLADRIGQIELNMERWRWLPRQLGTRHVMVNTAGFQLEVNEDDEPVLTMRVITGEKDRKTPVLGGKLKYIQFNPYWVVPSKIAAEELLPEQQRNPRYFSTHGYRVYDSWAADAVEVDPSTVDWSKFNKRNFPFLIRQDPGPGNALGRIKFIFENRYEIYLHDTPHRRLFNEENRAFSHGCVRVERPLDLARHLLGGETGWSAATITEAIDSGVTVNAPLPDPVPIYLVYLTAWVGAVNQVNFRDDVYERDLRMHQPGP